VTSRVNAKAELQAITGQLLSASPDSVESRIEEIRKFVARRLNNILDVLRKDTGLARAEILKHTREIKMTPQPATDMPYYVAEGNWDLIGSDLESVEGCKTFELSWARYAAYLVTEELIGSGGSYDDEIYTGRLLRVYTKSHFLDYLSPDTGGHTEPVQHYKLICLNHLIDVGSYAPPDIRLMGSASPSPLRIQ
jgi:hypothetical protein